MQPPSRARTRSSRAAVVLGLVVGLLLTLAAAATSAAMADPGNPGGPKPGWTGGVPTPTPTPHPTPSPHPTPIPASPSPTPSASPTPTEPPGSPGTHAAHDGYGYGFPEAPDCDEATIATGCVGDDRGFFQGQCTSWVAFRLGQRNGIAFSNWYTGRHWGDAADWARTARSIGRRPDELPAVGAVGWFRRGHVAYVEQVNGDGSIVISEMNFDGANGFRLLTVSPASSEWPDKFLHLADLISYDTTAPTAPGSPVVVGHRGRVGLSWRPSVDATGVAGYRVLRDGVPLALTTTPSYWDRRVSTGQSYSYAVVAYDRAGNTSAPVRARVAPGVESADRAWVPTAEGPALCGRTGTDADPSLVCTVLAAAGPRRMPLDRSTAWGHPGSRSFVASADGTVSYCRTVGAPGRARAACTTLDLALSGWRDDQISSPLPLLAGDRTWLPTPEGPALCGRAGTDRRQRLGCAVLTDHGWRFSRLGRTTPWGVPATRTFVAAGAGAVSYCRTVGPVPTRARLACTPFYPHSRSWGYDRSSRPSQGAVLAAATWLATEAGPALCGTGVRATGCRVLTWSGWRFVGVRRTAAAHPAGSAFVVDSLGRVSWCRTFGATTGATYRTACTRLDARRLRWGRDRTSPRVRALLADNRAWVDTAAGPALCGRVGTAAAQRVGCHVLTRRGWDWATVGKDWGHPGYRAFVPGDGSVAYCRTAGRASVSCTPLDASSLRWRTTRTAALADWALPDPV